MLKNIFQLDELGVCGSNVEIGSVNIYVPQLLLAHFSCRGLMTEIFPSSRYCLRKKEWETCLVQDLPFIVANYIYQ